MCDARRPHVFAGSSFTQLQPHEAQKKNTHKHKMMVNTDVNVFDGLFCVFELRTFRVPCSSCLGWHLSFRMEIAVLNSTLFASAFFHHFLLAFVSSFVDASAALQQYRRTKMRVTMPFIATRRILVCRVRANVGIN